MTDPTSELEVQAQSFQIVKVADAESFERGSAALRTIKEFLRRVAELFDPIDAAQIAARKTTIAQRKSLEDKPKALELAQKAELVAYDLRQEAIRREAEAVAERERKRIEEDARIQAALEAESRGEAKIAEAILDEAVGEGIEIAVILEYHARNAAGLGLFVIFRHRGNGDDLIRTEPFNVHHVERPAQLAVPVQKHHINMDGGIFVNEVLNLLIIGERNDGKIIRLILLDCC